MSNNAADVNTTQDHDAFLRAFRRFVRDSWVAGEAVTIMGAARALDDLRSRSTEKLDQPGGRTLALFDRLQRAGICILDDELSTRKQRVIKAFNWTGGPIHAQTLADGLSVVLGHAPRYSRKSKDAAAPAGRRVELSNGRSVLLAPWAVEDLGKLRTHLKNILARHGHVLRRTNDPRVNDAALIAAARCVPVERLHLLPVDARKVTDAKNAVNYVNRFLEYLFDHDLVAAVLPPPAFATPWGSWMASNGVLPTQRNWLLRLRDGLRAAFGAAAPESPDEVTVKQAYAAIERVGRKRGDDSAHKGVQRQRYVREVRGVLNALGLRGVGPFREMARIYPSQQMTERAWGPLWVLGPTASVQWVESSWSGTAALLEAHGFPEEWQTFWGWYADFSTLNFDALVSAYPGITRPSGQRRKRQLDAKTARQRFAALRTALGVAVVRLGIPPAEATMETVLGERFQEILLELSAAWEERVAQRKALAAAGLDAPGQDTSIDSPTIARHKVNMGLIAEGAWRWATYSDKRGSPVASPAAAAMWRASYDMTTRSEDGVALRRHRRVRKNIQQVVADVSGLALVSRNLIRLQSLIREPERHGGVLPVAIEAQRHLVGHIASMGMDRIGELASMLVDDVKSFESTALGHRVVRYIEVPEARRKAGPVHQIALVEEVVPTWFMNWWLSTGRPALMEKWITAGNCDHRHLFVSPETGAPVGGVPRTDGLTEIERREAIARRETNASGALGRMFEMWRRESLDRQGYAVVEGARGHHDPHSERNRVQLLGHECGINAREMAILLGHTPPSGDTATKLYGGSNAEINATTIRTFLEQSPWLRVGEAAVEDSVAGAQRKSVRERREFERSAKLGRDTESILIRLESLSPTKAYTDFLALRARHGIRGMEETSAAEKGGRDHESGDAIFRRE